MRKTMNSFSFFSSITQQEDEEKEKNGTKNEVKQEAKMPSTEKQDPSLPPKSAIINSPKKENDEDIEIGSEFTNSDDNQNLSTENKIYCLYDKVHRTGTKWRVNLKCAIARLKGKEYVISNINGEFNFDLSGKR